MANQVAYGFVNLADVFGRRVTEIGVDVVTSAIDQSLTEHNRQLDALINLFCTRTSNFKTRYRTPSASRLQPLDEHGRARPIVTSGQYDVSWPIHMAGAAYGQTFLAREKMTVAEVNQDIIAMQSADIRWMRDHILAALFTNASWTFTDDEHGSLTIQGLANNDTTKYLVQTGADQGATDTHYFAQASAIDNSNNPFDDLYDELLEHPENGGKVISLIPSNLKASVEALSTFNPIADPNIRVGANSDVLVGDLGVSVPGELFGYEDSKVWLVEWRSLPDNYIVTVTTEGERPLAIREEAIPSLVGFRRVANRDDHPYYESQFIRRAGFGAWNRVGAAVTRVGNGSYAIPTGYESPMA